MKRGAKKSKYPPDGEKQSMKSLTKNHKKFMESRPYAKAIEEKQMNEDAKEDLESLLEKAVTPKVRHRSPFL